jgi:Rieske Fe-S protein
VEPEHQSHDEPHLPAPTLWPIGFAIGIVVALVGLIINPTLISPIGGAIAIVFAILWAREATAELRGEPTPVEPERREPAAEVAVAEVQPAGVTRSRFLEASTLLVGGAIGGVITIPVAGFALLPGFLDQPDTRVDLGPLETFPVGDWFIATFVTDPKLGEVSKRTAFIRQNDAATVGGAQVPSFTIISNHCVHLGCPVQANGPTGGDDPQGGYIGKQTVREHTKNGEVVLLPVIPAGYGCPCHGGQYDPEGNRTAGPPVRALDRYDFEIKDGHLWLLGTYSVSHVEGTGADAKIYRYKEAGPGEHIDGIEQILYPIQPPHH